MISAKQLKNIIDYMMTDSTDNLAPTATFTITPDTYTLTAVPASVSLSGAITLNDGTLTSWAITESASGTAIATGTGTSVSATLPAVGTIPTSVGTYTYYLTVYYTDATGTASSILVSDSLSVTAEALIGQLNGTEDLVLPADLTGGMEATLSTTDKATLINLFTVTASAAAGYGRIIFVIPDSYGVVSSIEDGAGLDVLSQFNVIIDAPNSRTLYTAINTVTTGSYDYKIVF
jgi:hypothetical protein